MAVRLRLCAGWRPRRVASGIVAVLVGLVLIAYGGASVYVYDRLSLIAATCTERADPASFMVDGVDTGPYWMPPTFLRALGDGGVPSSSVSPWAWASASLG